MKYIIAIILFATTLFFANKIYKNINKAKQIALYNKSIPNIQLITTEKKLVNLSENNQKTHFLIFFDSYCDHCQAEAKELEKHLSEFQNAQLTFISMDLMRNIIFFASEYKLNKQPNIRFCQIDSEVLSTNFGPMGFPTIFIYNADNQLVKKISGQVPMKEIISYID